MTNKQKCLKQWKWFIDNPGKDKTDWAEANPKDAEEVKEYSHCHACLETYINKSICEECPVNWETGKCNYCTVEGSKYYKWINGKTSENAIEVYNTIKKTWEE